MSGYSGFGTTLSIATNEVAELTSISGPSVSMDTIDVSAHNAGTEAADGYRDFVAGLIDGGEVSMEGNLTTVASAGYITGAMEDRTEKAIVITFPTAAGVSTWTFDGIVTGFSTEAPYDDKLSFSASIKVTGRPVLA